ncbi:MAG: hypothetical protein K6G85_03865 [Eubacterium sp.]|nr:hypothetical protein [Eubacterium sp.]
MKLLATIVLVMIVMVLWFICAAAGYESDLDFKEKEPEKEIKESRVTVINLETMEVEEDVSKIKQTGQGNEAEL